MALSAARGLSRKSLFGTTATQGAAAASLRPGSRPAVPDATTQRFQLAIQRSSILKTSRAQALRLYGLFKSATDGDCPPGSPPEDERERAKWEAWAALRGVPQQSAQDEYCELVESLAERGAYPPARADALTRTVPGAPPARGRHEGRPLLLTEGDSDQSGGPCPRLKTVTCGCSVM